MASNSAKKLGTTKRNSWLQTFSQNAAKPEAGNLRILLDTNVWYSALLYGGKPEQVVVLCRQNHDIVSSAYLFGELFGILKQLKTPYRWRNNLERVLTNSCIMVEPPDFSGISRDPKDDPIIAAAIAGRCDYLVTNDNDLLELGGYKTMRIITPAKFFDLHTTD